jgi:hypothetical protein
MKTGDFRIRIASETWDKFWAMKILNRTLLGVISCFLLSAGLSKAAQQLDPLTKSFAVQSPHAGSADVSAMECSSPCMLMDKIN